MLDANTLVEQGPQLAPDTLKPQAQPGPEQIVAGRTEVKENAVPVAMPETEGQTADALLAGLNTSVAHEPANAVAPASLDTPPARPPRPNFFTSLKAKVVEVIQRADNWVVGAVTSRPH